MSSDGLWPSMGMNLSVIKSIVCEELPPSRHTSLAAGIKENLIWICKLNAFCVTSSYYFSVYFIYLFNLNVRTCWHCWGLPLTCKINFKFILSVVFDRKCKQVGSFCSVLQQDLLLTVIRCQGFTLLVNHKYFLTKLFYFQWNILLFTKAVLNWNLVALTFNLIFTHDRIPKKYWKA